MLDVRLSSLTPPCHLSHVPREAFAYIVASLYATKPRPIIAVIDTESDLERTLAELRWYVPSATVLGFPAWDTMPYDRTSPSTHLINQRLATLAYLHDQPEKPVIVLATLQSLIQRIPTGADLFAETLSIRKGMQLSHNTCITRLSALGFTRVDTVCEAGEFSVRGSLIDVMVAGQKQAIRIDFFGDEIDSLRAFDPETQLTTAALDHFELLPGSEVLLRADTIENFTSSYRQEFNINATHDPLYQAIQAGRPFPGMEQWLPLFYHQLCRLDEYLRAPLLIAEASTLNPEMDPFARIHDYYQARQDLGQLHASQAPYRPLAPGQLWLEAEEWHGLKLQQNSLLLHPFQPNQPALSLDLYTTPMCYREALQQRLPPFAPFASHLEQHPLPTWIGCDHEAARERLKIRLQQEKMTAIALDSLDQVTVLKSGMIGLAIVPLKRGFRTSGWQCFSEEQLLGERLIRKTSSRKALSHLLSEAASFMPGTLVVHQDHGIGRFEALETLVVSGTPHDCLRLIYDGGDKLYIPVENIAVLSRYGTEDEVKLDKLGGVSWQQRKARMKAHILEMAESLLHTAAQRLTDKGPALDPPASAYEHFCDAFPYIETEDQLGAITDIEADFRSERPMDRLVCGDVGFGKTEVAMRAACLALDLDPATQLPRKQVAVIVPTTLLCRQHYQTFLERFRQLPAARPIRVESLSRFTPANKVKDIHNALAEGQIDIVIGTHALLGKQVVFKDLSLMIIDEEQHFGVAQKERMKQLRSQIHVLTLSATPIPRTLQMALSGLRELSLIASPPIDRTAVRTMITPFDPVTIREACLNEYQRGGKVFFVVPRISDLQDLHDTLQSLLPEFRIAMAHGQMAPSKLDVLVQDFYDGKYDMLLSTTIVESGLDIPSADTIFIYRADRLGLSQLYQLRGRVGRGKQRAFAYLLLPERQALTEMATKRLEVMQSLDTLGAGFSLASHDMDIRGFGNLVGEEQSGQVREVGVELYQNMLQEAVASLNLHQQQPDEEAITVASDWTTQINMGVAVLIPEEYIPDLGVRLGLYRRIGAQTDPQELQFLANEMEDRFGPLPEETRHLFGIMQLKQRCKGLAIEKVEVGERGIVLEFHHGEFTPSQEFIRYLQTHPHLMKLRADQSVVYLKAMKTAAERLSGVEEALALFEKLRG
jgi:transcription-repair coupling factor (superfamily II helicase)